MGIADELLSRLLHECPTPETQIRKEALSYALDHMENSPRMKSLCLDLLENALSAGEFVAIPEEGDVPTMPVQEEPRGLLLGVGYGLRARQVIREGLGLDR